VVEGKGLAWPSVAEEVGNVVTAGREAWTGRAIATFAVGVYCRTLTVDPHWNVAQRSLTVSSPIVRVVAIAYEVVLPSRLRIH
jgi:hypothetical protein